MLKNLKIAGFKSIREQTLELGRVTVLIGQNGAGKSNVLEAVGMLSAASAGTVSYEYLSSRGVRLSSPGVYKSALKGGGHRPKYFDLSADFDNLRYHANIYTSDVAGANAWSFHAESLYKKNLKGKWIKAAGRSPKGLTIGGRSLDKKNVRPTESILPGVELLGQLSESEQASLDSLKMFAIYAPATNVLRGVDGDNKIKTPLGLTGGGLVQAIRDVITSSKDRKDFARFFKILSWYKDMSITYPSSKLKSPLLSESSVLAFRDQFMIADFDKLYSYDVSEGALYVAFLLALMLHEKSPQFFAIDNVDSALNPGLIRNLVAHACELANKRDKQVIFTTHNPASLDALDIFNDDYRLYVVDRSESGATELNRLSPPPGMSREEWDRETGGAKLSELWLDGLLGGITPSAGF